MRELAGCLAHVRRKFYDAQDSDEQRAAQMLALIGELYALEREAKEAGIDEAAVLALRRERSVPALEKIKIWLDAEQQVGHQANMIGVLGRHDRFPQGPYEAGGSPR